ncbi:MAG: histidine phosphatase family protein [Rhodospirillales bacterium]|nr:histidine phosphatase family protein [Rhodospirillales bacterium]
MTAPRLLLVRHGETPWTRMGRIQGRADPGLHPEGEAQIAILAGRLRAEWEAAGRAVALIASPLRRAAESAAILAARLGKIRPQLDPRLMELDFGAWEGLTDAQVKQRWPTLRRSWKQTPDTVRLPGGESLAEARARWRDFLAGPPWNGTPALAVVVTHAAMIRIALLEARGEPLGRFREIAVAPASAHRFDPPVPTGKPV